MYIYTYVYIPTEDSRLFVLLTGKFGMDNQKTLKIQTMPTKLKLPQAN